MVKKKSNNKMVVMLGGAFALVVAIFVVMLFSNNTRLIYIGNAEVETILADNSGAGTFVYIGSPSCPVCNTFRPTVESVLRSMGAEMYYFETDLAIADDLERTIANLERTATSTPTIVYLVNGEVIDFIHATSANQLQAFLERDLGALR